jgi:magnesium-transporting ATPase (P-type)
MERGTQESEPSLTSRVFSRPSSTLGWVAVVAMVASIAGVILINAAAAEGTEGEHAWQRVVVVAVVLCLPASWILALVAVFRRGERSWLVLLPTALFSLVIVNELVQGLVQLAGLGSE